MTKVMSSLFGMAATLLETAEWSNEKNRAREAQEGDSSSRNANCKLNRR